MKKSVFTVMMILCATPALAAEPLTGEALSKVATPGRSIDVTLTGAPAKRLFSLLRFGLQPEAVSGAAVFRGDNISCSAALTTGGFLANHQCRFNIDSLGEMTAKHEADPAVPSEGERASGKATFSEFAFTKEFLMIQIGGDVAEQIHALMLKANDVEPIGGDFTAINGRNIMCHVERPEEITERRFSCSFFVSHRGGTEANQFIELARPFLPTLPILPVDDRVRILPIDPARPVDPPREINTGITLPYLPIR